MYFGLVTDSFSTGDVTSSVTGYNSSYSGGIAGYVNGGTIKGGYSNGNVASSVSSNIVDGAYSGGIAGHVTGGTIADSYSTGDITSSVGNINTRGVSGGIAGHVSGSSINNCVAINEKIFAGEHAGRIAGYIQGAAAVSNNFALTNMNASGVAKFDVSNKASHGVSKTNTELRTQSSYSNTISGDGLGGLGWKFGNNSNNPWKMPVGGGYPIQYWQ